MRRGKIAKKWLPGDPFSYSCLLVIMAFLGSGVSYFPHRYRPRFRRGIFSDAFDGSMLASQARRASMRRNHAMLDVVDGDPELTSITGARPVRSIGRASCRERVCQNV